MEYVYNNADQLTHSQDGVQRASGKWLYYKYDGFNRMTEWGVTTSKTATTGTAYVKNYYDGYSFIGTTGFTNGNFTSSDTNGRGKLTGSVVTVPGHTVKLYKAFYFDSKGQMIKSVESNLMAGYNVVNTTYSFTGKPLTVTRAHNGGSGFSMSETYTYSYDHADRLIKTEHTLNGSTITMAEYTYDNLGRMSSKKLHGKEAFRTDYTYNIRNWLTAMAGDLFTQNLHYTDGLGTAYYNGNISSMTWQAGNETILRGYKYTYDGLNRMKNGTYGEGDTLGTNAGRYSEIAHNYDKNGNLGAGFLRNGRISDGSYSTISALVPTYNGNQLQSMYDACPYTPYEGTFGYDAGYGDGIEYFYDGNGNLTQDLNKGISNISYNMLSLPSVVTFSDGSTITYYYDAEGNKVRVIYNITGETSLQRNYSNGVIYDNGRQQCLITEEGYIALQENNKYYYYLKDHQGNNRVVVDEDENIVEVNHYYPFGGVFEPTGDVQRYKYNGKEYITNGDLNWYDYGARHYDPAIGRFTTMDPLAEKYYSTSPYAYCLNNPIKHIDVDGKFPFETVWDAFNLTLGLQSLKSNLKSGNYWDATVDGLGLALDAAATALPYIPGGVSSAIKAARGADDLVDAANATNKVDNVSDISKTGKFDGKADTQSNTANEAFRKAKDQNGIPRSQQPDRVIKPNTPEGKEMNLNDKNVKLYEFTNSKGEKVLIRQDKPTFYNDGGTQPAHYNSGLKKDIKLKQHHNYEY